MKRIVDSAIQNFLSGRIWHRLHTPFTTEQIDAHIKSGHIKKIQGINSTKSLTNKQTHFCNRCENDNQTRFTTFTCAKCVGDCTYCRHCLKMGRVSTCTELIIWNGPTPGYRNAQTITWQGKLTPHQQRASDELIASNARNKSHLVYAVCGSGKTEILFRPIHTLLIEGKRICLAAPRVDVILELEPRLRAAFPETAIEALYGGAKPGKDAAQLILATTHQLYRFRNAFDVIFIDEADAFPYTADDTLQRAVTKAAKRDAPIHAVTATPTKKLLMTHKKTGAISTINRRYHGYDLPIPRYESLWNYTRSIQKEKLPKKLITWTTEQLNAKRPFLIFSHHIALMEQAEPLFKQLNADIKAAHAAHPDRKESVQSLRDNEIPGLLTTTILERGITIPNIQVAVVGAEQQTFNKGALIQIGGRVGRSSDFPTGDFVLFHHGISQAMDEAKVEIGRLNKGGTS